MKKFIWTLIFPVLLVPAANAAEPNAADLSPNAIADAAAQNPDFEKYLEDAIQNQIQSLKSTLPMQVNPGVVWQDIAVNDDSLNYIYQIDIDEMLNALPEELRKGFDPAQKQEIVAKIKTEMCPQVKPILCVSLDLMSTFSPRLANIAATYNDKAGQQFLHCGFNKKDCADLVAKYSQPAKAAE